MTLSNSCFINNFSRFPAQSRYHHQGLREKVPENFHRTRQRLNELGQTHPSVRRKARRGPSTGGRCETQFDQTVGPGFLEHQRH